MSGKTKSSNADLSTGPLKTKSAGAEKPVKSGKERKLGKPIGEGGGGRGSPTIQKKRGKN